MRDDRNLTGARHRRVALCERGVWSAWCSGAGVPRSQRAIKLLAEADANEETGATCAGGPATGNRPERSRQRKTPQRL